MNYAKHKVTTHVINKQGLKYSHFTLTNHKNTVIKLTDIG